MAPKICTRKFCSATPCSYCTKLRCSAAAAIARRSIPLRLWARLCRRRCARWPSCGLADQLEQIKITPEYLSTEEMSKLWTAVQSHYRPTAAYMATVVLIESTLPARATAAGVEPRAGGSGHGARPRHRGRAEPAVAVADNSKRRADEACSPSQQWAERSKSRGTISTERQCIGTFDQRRVFRSNRKSRPPPAASSTACKPFTVPDLPAGIYQLAVSGNPSR